MQPEQLEWNLNEAVKCQINSKNGHKLGGFYVY